MQYVVRSGSLKHFPDLMTELGQSPFQLLEECGIELSALHNPDVHIPYQRFAGLLNRAGLRCKRSDIGALLAQRYGLEMLGALGPLLAMQPSVGRALEMIQKHIGFHARGLAFHTAIHDQYVTVSVRLEFAEYVDCTQLVTLSIGAFQQVLRQLSGEMFLATVSLRRKPPSEAEAYHALFQHAVHFEQDEDHIRLPLELLARPVQIEPLLQKRMGWLLRHFGPDNLSLPIGQQVEKAIRASLPTGDCNLEQVAAMVSLHPRVLQKQLQRDGGSFRSALNRVRKELACEHLRFSDISLNDLALNLGYSELSAFSRSFKNWIGMSPQAWKATQRVRVQASPDSMLVVMDVD